MALRCLHFPLAASALLALVLPSQAAILNVPAQYANIQTAVTAAASGDTVLVADGTYTGAGNRDVDFNGKNLTVMSQHGPTKTIIDCGGFASSDGSGNHRGFYIHSGEINTVINGFTINNGFIDNGDRGAADGHEGSGICVYNSSATVQNCVITGPGGYNPYHTNGYISENDCGIYDGNSSHDGGVFTMTGCTLSGIGASGVRIETLKSTGVSITLSGCTISGNGDVGLYNWMNIGTSTLTVTGCTFANNRGLSYGGGVFNESYYPDDTYGTATLTNCTFTGNSSINGGGVYDTGGMATLTNCTLSNNAAAQGGGGILMEDSGTATLSGCILSGNTSSDEGGGLCVDTYGAFALNNCVITGNHTDGVGGGLATRSDGLVTVTGCNFNGNTAPQGGGVYGTIRGNFGPATLFNDILRGDTGGEIVNSDGSPAFVEYCDVQGLAALPEDSGNVYNIDADPLFVNAAGGDFHLLPGSPCLGAGGDNGTPLADKDGNLRPDPPAIGAYEIETVLAGTIPVLWSATDGSLILWNYAAATGAFTQRAFGPYPGWSVKTIAEGPDFVTRVLWTKADGTMSLWRLDTSTGRYTQHTYGPFPGWTAKGISAASDETTHVLWTSTNGTASLWNCDAATGSYTYKNYGPYGTWSAVAVADGPYGRTRLLWTNTDGSASLWSLNTATGAYTQHTFGPYPGWTAKAISVGNGVRAASFTHVLWTNTNGQASVWNYSAATGAYTQHTYGPYSSWSAQSIADGYDGRTRLLWTNPNGQMSLWDLNNTIGIYTQRTYGPYPGWTAGAVAAP